MSMIKRMAAIVSVAALILVSVSIAPWTQETPLVDSSVTTPTAPTAESALSDTSKTTTTAVSAPLTTTTAVTVTTVVTAAVTPNTTTMPAETVTAPTAVQTTAASVPPDTQPSVSQTVVTVATSTAMTTTASEAPQIVTVTRTHGDVESSSASVEMTLDSVAAQTLSLTPSSQGKRFPSSMPGFLGSAYDLAVDAEFDAATLSFTWDTQTAAVEPTVYRYSEDTQQLVAVPTAVDGQTATATVEDAATYVLLDRAVYEASLTWEDTWGVADVYATTEVVLVIDDSGTMTTTDAQAKRLEAARDLVARLPQNSRVGVVRFSNEIERLTPSLTDDREAVAETLTTDTFVSRGGTKMYTAIEEALSLYESDGAFTQRVMVVLTDGWAVDTFAYDTIVETIGARDIRLYAIGLDGADDSNMAALQAFSQDVDGTFCYAADAEALGDVYATIGKQVDITTDGDGDTIPDYYEDHMIAFNGVTVPLDKTKADTDEDGIPDNEEVAVSLVYSEDGAQVYIKGTLLSDPSLTDTDGDGMTDDVDKAPFDNGFHSTMTTAYATSSMKFTMDYAGFFSDNTTYVPALSQVSALLSALAYEESSLRLVDTPNEQTLTTTAVADVLAYFGMQQPQNFKLGDRYSDIHISEVTVGYRNVVCDGTLKTVLAVVIRGTNGTIAEWSSNCDIGNLLADTADDDWVNTLNHKGFDVAATRIRRFVDEYIAAQGLCEDNIAYWVTGHSRGAGIANIIGAALEREGKEAFTYTFAAPNTTLATDAASYRTIFNVINADDFVPCMPMDLWGYTRYGVSTGSLSVADSYETNWENFTGIWDYNPPGSGMAGNVDTIAGIIAAGADPRVDTYKYTCSCHGDGSNDTITITNTGMSESSRENAIAKIPANALAACIITRYEGGWLGGWDFDVCQSPAYFMQLLAAFMGGEIDAYRFAVELNIADRYESAKSALVSLGINGVEHPHYPETYVMLSQYVTANDFA